MSLTWWHERNGNENRVPSKKVIEMPRRDPFDSLWIKIPAGVLLALGAIYFLGHIIAAWMRGSFGGW